MLMICGHCDRQVELRPERGLGSRSQAVLRGWTSIVAAGQEVWTCPECHPTRPTYQPKPLAEQRAIEDAFLMERIKAEHARREVDEAMRKAARAEKRKVH
jgi:hypothetical protein